MRGRASSPRASSTPNPEDVGSATSDDVADNLTAVTGATDDLFDRHTHTSGALDDSIIGLTPQKSLVLAPLGASEQIRVDRTSSERLAN
jgi:hypothetical protein